MTPFQLSFVLCLTIFMVNFAVSSSNIIPTISAAPAVMPDPVVGPMPSPGLSPDLTPRFPSPNTNTRPSPPAPPSFDTPPNFAEASAPGPGSEEAPAPSPMPGGSFTHSATLGFFTSTFVALLCFLTLA